MNGACLLAAACRQPPAHVAVILVPILILLIPRLALGPIWVLFYSSLIDTSSMLVLLYKDITACAQQVLFFFVVLSPLHVCTSAILQHIRFYIFSSLSSLLQIHLD